MKSPTEAQLIAALDKLHEDAIRELELELADDLGKIIAHLLVPPRPTSSSATPWSEVP